MFMPASASSTIFPTKKKLCAYSVAFDENSKPPVNAAMAKAIDVQGKSSRVRRPTARSTEASPNRRRSTIEIVPTTVTIASTCTDSIQGNSDSFSRISVATPVASRDLSQSSRSTPPVLRFRPIGDPAAGEDDADPEEEENTGDDARRGARLRRWFGGRRIPDEAQERERRDERGEQQRHLELEDRIAQRPRRLAHDHDDAGEQQDQQRPPDQGKKARGDAFERLVAPEETKKPEGYHQDRRHDQRDREDMDRLHRRHDPAGALDHLTRRRLLEPSAERDQPSIHLCFLIRRRCTPYTVRQAMPLPTLL